jgi:hypothetical protein
MEANAPHCLVVIRNGLVVVAFGIIGIRPIVGGTGIGWIKADRQLKFKAESTSFED